MEFLSTKQIADRLGVSKQRVYRCIKKHCIKEAHSETVNGNTVLMYDNAAFIMISELLSSGNDASSETPEAHQEVHQEVPNEAPNEALNETLYRTLLRQLDVKDEQIKQLHMDLAEERNLVKAAHQLLHDEQQRLSAAENRIMELEDKIAAADQKQEIQEILEPEKTEEPEEPAQKNWLRRIFKF